MTQQQLATAQLGRERVATEADQLKLDQTKAQQAQDKQVEDIVRIPEDQRTLKQKDDLSAWQRVQHINDPQEKQLADAILTKIKNGQPPERHGKEFCLFSAAHICAATGGSYRCQGERSDFDDFSRWKGFVDGKPRTPL